jgi:long-chain acyl-CoA synthetase
VSTAASPSLSLGLTIGEAPAGVPTTVVAALLGRAAATPDAVALHVYDAASGGVRPALTWRAWADEARAFAAGLVEAGVRPGDVVAVLAGNRPCWPVADLGALMAGAVVAGVYPTAPAAQLRAVLADSGARLLVVDTAEQWEKARGVVADLPLTGRVVCADQAAGAPVAWDGWLEAGRAAVAGAAGGEVDRRVAALRPEDVAALVYTSGSTGEPKGACIPHAALVASGASVRDALGLTAADTALSFLPYAHSAERVFGQATRLVCGMAAALVPDPADVWAAARAYAPTLFGGLPRYYEKAHDSLLAAERDGPAAERDGWAATWALGAERSRLRRAGRPVPAALDGEWEAARGPARRALAAVFGARVRLATSGGAPLPAAAAERLDAAGLTVLGAYGQTEHLCVAMHRPGAYDFKTAGPPMPGTELRVAADGELLVRRSALTFAGYIGRPDATRAAFTPDGGWLRTGDLGEVGADGRVRVTGRLREMLALSTGKKVAPVPIEARLAEHPLVAHALVVGEGRRYAAALLFLADAGAGRGASNAATDGAADLATHVAAVNADLPPHERVRRFHVTADALSAEAGDLTPTHKVRRAAVEARYAHIVDALYT